MTDYIILYNVKGYLNPFTLYVSAEDEEDARKQCLQFESYADIICISETEGYENV